MSINGSMHPKTKAFADMMIANPKLSQTQAYLNTHTTNRRLSASVESTKLLKKPNVRLYMQKHSKIAKETVIDVMENSRKNKDEPQHATIALRAAQDILDRTYGKAVSKSENVNLNINVEEALNMLS